MSVPETKIVDEIPASMQKLARLVARGFYGVEHNLLWNGTELQCTFCRSAVEEDSNALPNQDTRSSLARFNERMWPFFQLMQELEGVQLALHLLEPTPAVMRKNRPETAGDRKTGGAEGGSAARGHRTDAEYEPYKPGFTVDIEGSGGGAESRNGAQTVKEVPVWLLSEAGSPPRDGRDRGPVEFGRPAQRALDESSGAAGFGSPRRDIADALLVHESAATAARKDRQSPPAPRIDVERPGSGARVAERDEEDDDEFEEVAADSDDEAASRVTVQGRPYSLADVTENPDLISEMTPDEKQYYIKLSQQAFKRMYGD